MFFFFPLLRPFFLFFVFLYLASWAGPCIYLFICLFSFLFPSFPFPIYIIPILFSLSLSYHFSLFLCFHISVKLFLFCFTHLPIIFVFFIIFLFPFSFSPFLISSSPPSLISFISLFIMAAYSLDVGLVTPFLFTVFYFFFHSPSS